MNAFLYIFSLAFAATSMVADYQRQRYAATQLLLFAIYLAILAK